MRKQNKTIIGPITITFETSPETDPVSKYFETQHDIDLVNELIKSGNPLAWCRIKVSAKCNGLEASSTLVACTYNSILGFIDDGDHLKDMMDEVTKDLISKLERDPTELSLDDNKGTETE